MELTAEDKAIVEKTFAMVVPIADTAAELFYGRLFEIDPTTKPLFKSTDMFEQGRKLMQTLGVAVGSIHNLEAFAPEVVALGKRHVHYGVTQEQYDSVGAALLWTLEQGLKDNFTPEAREAWTKVYGLLAGLAIQAYDEE